MTQPQSSGFDADVLVVGLGPVGAVMALLLAREGVSVVAVDRDTEVYPLPRAVHFDHEIMRLFQQLGLAETMLAHARPLPVYEFKTADGRILVSIPPAPRTPSGWAAGYMFHQPGLETALRAAISASPSARMRTGVRLTGFEQDDSGVTASLLGPEGESRLRTRWLIGCDGASSLVRQTIGAGLSDYGFDEPWLVVDARLLPGSAPPEANLQICDPKRPTTCVQGGPGRHRWEFMLLPGETAETVTRDEFIRPLIDAWNCGPLVLERRAVYRFHGLVADRWRDRRVLLAGDSAHQTPPFAGQGMCSGLRDAANLAWKLSAVLHSRAGETLIDTYQTEREPHCRALIELAIGMGRVVCALDPGEAAARDEAMLAARAAGRTPLPPSQPPAFAAGCILVGCTAAGAPFPQPIAEDGMRLDEVLGEGPWLIQRQSGPAPDGVRGFSLDEAALAPFRRPLETWLTAQSASAVLVRPDRYVFGCGEAAELGRAWSAALQGT